MKTEILLFCLCAILVTLCDDAHADTGQKESRPTPFNDLEANEIQKTIALLKEGERRLKIDENYRDVILLIGNTGSGRSTLTQFVAGNLADLESVGEDNFVIESRHKDVIGNSTTVSHTIYPDLVIDETKTAFYDCPGFEDTRSMSIEVASTYFVKKVVDHAKSIKIVLVVDYGSVHVGGSRTDFPKLVQHFRSFVKNVTAYNDSITLIANKVPNEYEKANNLLVLKSDEKVIRAIARFLEESRDQLRSEEKSEFNAYALELIEILLQKNVDGKAYKKIGFFRSPDVAGPFNQIEALVERRSKLRDLIINRTIYGKNIDGYFGYTNLEASKLKLIDLTQAINREMKVNVRNVSKEFEDSFRGEEQKLGNLAALANRFQSGYNFVSAIILNTENLTGTQLVAQLANAANSLP